MVIVNNQLPLLLNIRRSDNGKVNPVEPASKIPKYNNNDRSFNEQKRMMSKQQRLYYEYQNKEKFGRN
jgi:hypothetical protein